MIEVYQDIQTFAKNRKEALKLDYLNSPNYIIEHYRSEREAIEEYDGRQLLEMLQNADDASADAPESKVYIQLKDQQLIIANTGHHFTRDGLESILYRNISPKFKERYVIGNKGLGFRAILSWVDKVSIYSGQLKVAFSEENSYKFLDELINEKPSIKDIIEKKNKGFEYTIATLRVPEIIPARPDYLPQDYDTYVVLDLKKGIEENVIKQIQNSVDLRSLIFVNHLEEIFIDVNGLKRTLKADRRKKNSIELSEISDSETLKDIWYVHSIEGIIEKTIKDKIENHFYKISVAWQDEWDENNEYLYSYFKTQVPFSFPGLLHGTFELTPDRNRLLSKSTFNSELIKKIPQLLCETSVKIAQQNSGMVNYKALSFLNIEFDGLDAPFKEVDFHSILIDNLKETYIFPNISNTYISFKEEPVMYEDEVFSKILNADVFDDVLIHIEKETFDYTFENKLKFLLFNNNYFFESISENLEYYGAEDYARLIIALLSTDNFHIDDNTSALFYDNEKKLLSFGNKIFIPDNNDFVSSIRGLQTQIIDVELYENLKNLCNEEGIDVENLLEKYKLSSFTICEVIDLLLENYKTKTTIEAIVDLNKRLFELFKKYKNELGTIWDGKEIPLLSIKKSIVSSNALYFTKNYGEKLVHEIYKYNPTKLIANYKIFDISEDEASEWKSYLKWAGVAEIPRKFYREIRDNAFADFCLRKYDFSNKIDGHIYKNHKHFTTFLNYYGNSTVYTVDDLSNLLKHNSVETILTWLFLDDELKSYIEKDIEPIGSQVKIRYHYGREDKILADKKLKNYVKWQVSNIPWLLTDNDTKRIPVACTTSVTITEDFNGILDKPKINYEHITFVNAKLKKPQIQYLLQIIGVHESIATLSTHDLYNILLKLPELDKEGKKVKSIYREIATNYDESTLDEEDGNYLKFKEAGKIFCQTSVNDEDYLPVGEAFYIDNKRYGNSIINLFNRASLDRRKGKSKIEKLFSIRTLEDLKIVLKDEPVLHSLNNDFEKELQQFKPYVYVFRQDVDKNGTERNRIKNTKFKLMKPFTVNVNFQDIKKEALLGDYEYYYNSSKNELLIVCPNHIRTIEESKTDVLFCSAVAEAFSSLLDIEQQRNQIRELYSKNLTGRNQLLSEELDDTNTERLQKAKEALNIISNQKLEFWIAFLRCLPNKKPKQLNTDEQLFKELERLFKPDEYTFIKSLINEINYDNLNDRSSISQTASLLIRFDIKLEKLNSFIYPIVNLKPLYENYFVELKESEKPKFRKLLYLKCKSDAKIRSKFLDVLEDYDHFILSDDYSELEYENEVLSYFEDYCKENFSIDINNLTSTDHIDIDEIRKSNKLILLEKVGFTNQQYAHYRENKPEIESLLYFESEIQDLAVAFKGFIEDLKGKTNSGTINFSNNFKLNDKDIYFDTYEDLLEKLKNTWSSDDMKKCTFNKISTLKGEEKGQSKKEGSNGKGTRKNYRNQNHIGFIAEYIVWKFLQLNLAKENTTEWVSEYAREAGINPEGKDGFGFDLKYIPKNAKTYSYVEVKAVGWDNSFNISPKEIKEAEKLKNKHKIFLVSNVDDIENVVIKEISGLFTYDSGKNFYDNEKFSVLNDNFIIKYDILDYE